MDFKQSEENESFTDPEDLCNTSSDERLSLNEVNLSGEKQPPLNIKPALGGL